MKRLLIGVGIACVVILASQTLVSAGAPERTDVVEFDPPNSLLVADGAWLVRSPNGISAGIGVETGEYASGVLASGDAVTIWAVVFNAPDNCDGGCGEDEVTTPDHPADVAVIRLAGKVLGKGGNANFAGHVASGTGADPFFDVVGFGNGTLSNPEGAEVHLVVRTHGPKVAAEMPDQIHYFAGGCADAGPPCDDIMAAIFPPPA